MEGRLDAADPVDVDVVEGSLVSPDIITPILIFCVKEKYIFDVYFSLLLIFFQFLFCCIILSKNFNLFNINHCLRYL